jgi:uncharacterized protein YbbC (DUF1343 family)
MGDRARPAAEMLQGLDVVVIDVPDSGLRFNPLVSRVAMMLEECSRRGVAVTMLDRPNPLGGFYTDGPYPDPRLRRTELSYLPTPIAYGMTLGELMRFYNAYLGVQADLSVVPMVGWKRYWTFDRTGLAWRTPGANLSGWEVCMLSGGLAIAGAANVSVGLGADAPYRLVGAPWIDARELAAEFSAHPVEGLEVEPVTFTPAAAPSDANDDQSPPWPYAGQTCRGLRFRVTDPERFQSVRFGVRLLHTLNKLYPNSIEIDRAVAIIGRPDIIRMIKTGQPVEKIIASWSVDRLDFNSIKIDYLLY